MVHPKQSDVPLLYFSRLGHKIDFKFFNHRKTGSFSLDILDVHHTRTVNFHGWKFSDWAKFVIKFLHKWWGYQKDYTRNYFQRIYANFSLGYVTVVLILVRTDIFGNRVKVEQAFVTLGLAEFWHSLTITWFTRELVILEIINLLRNTNNLTEVIPAWQGILY